MSPDPMNQFASGYVYCANNPIAFIDPSGMWAEGSDAWNSLNEQLDEIDKKEKKDGGEGDGGGKKGKGSKDKREDKTHKVEHNLPNTFSKLVEKLVNSLFPKKDRGDGEEVRTVNKKITPFLGGPVAYIVSFNVSVVATQGVDVEPIGAIHFLKGKNAGETYLIEDAGYGGGNEISGSIQAKAAFIFYTGKPEDFSLSEFLGGRTEANISKSFYKFMTVGSGGTVGDVSKRTGNQVIGIHVTAGFGLDLFQSKYLKTPITVNYGNTSKY